MMQSDLDRIAAALVFHADPGFWIGLGIGVIGIVVSAVGLWFSLQAFREAREAKLAAREAGRAVKRQTANIELTALLQDIEAFNRRGLGFEQAQNLLTRTTRAVLRLTGPYRDDPVLRSYCKKLEVTLSRAAASLETVWTMDTEFPVGDTVYLAMRIPFSDIDKALAILLGRFDSDHTEANQ